MQKLGIIDEEARELATLFGQERFTEMAPAADLLTSWGTLVVAEREDWPERAQVIGRLLRDMMEGESVKRSLIGDLNSLIYLSPVLVANAGKYIHWMPTMNEVMTSKDELLTRFLAQGVSIESRLQHISQVKVWSCAWCSRDGFSVGAGIKAQYQRCVARQCKKCEPGAHRYPMEDMDVVDD